MSDYYLIREKQSGKKEFLLYISKAEMELRRDKVNERIDRIKAEYPKDIIMLLKIERIY